MRILPLLVLFACGTEPIDTSPDLVDTVDTSPPDPLAFDTPVSAALGATGFITDDPTLDSAAVVLAFRSSRSGGAGNSDIWFSARGFVTGSWDAPENPSAVNSASNDSTPELSANGRELYFTSDRDGNYDVFVSTRTDSFSPFRSPQKIAVLNSGGDELNPTPSADGLSLYLVRRPGNNLELYVSSRESTSDSWSAPVPVEGPNSSDNESDPFLSADGLMLFFSSDRSGGLGGYDIWVCKRATVDEAWGPAEAVEVLNSAGRDADPWLSEDGSRFWLSSDRDGDIELYEAIHPELSE